MDLKLWQEVLILIVCLPLAYIFVIVPLFIWDKEIRTMLHNVSPEGRIKHSKKFDYFLVALFILCGIVFFIATIDVKWYLVYPPVIIMFMTITHLFIPEKKE